MTWSKKLRREGVTGEGTQREVAPDGGVERKEEKEMRDEGHLAQTRVKEDVGIGEDADAVLEETLEPSTR